MSDMIRKEDKNIEKNKKVKAKDWFSRYNSSY